MKNRIVTAGIILLSCIVSTGCVATVYVPGPAPSRSHPPRPSAVGHDVAIFYDALSFHGRWIWLNEPGWVWSPRGVPAGWRPYVDGHWAYTDYGWTWVSTEPYGWAVYHYGRWMHEPSHGWLWVPGSDWAPAWVTWHWGDGWIGWAPLPWSVRWRAGVGLDWGGVDVRAAVDPAWWCFVRARHMVEPALKRHVVPASRNVTLIRVTRNVTHYTFVEDRIVNVGVGVDAVRRATRRPIPRLRVRAAEAAHASRGGLVKDGEVLIYRPGDERADQPGRRAVGPAGSRVRSTPAAAGAHGVEQEPQREQAREQKGRKRGPAAARTNADPSGRSGEREAAGTKKDKTKEKAGVKSGRSRSGKSKGKASRNDESGESEDSESKKSKSGESDEDEE